ncbi:MAG: YfhO family protein, partial [Aquaticitalea sp.]
AAKLERYDELFDFYIAKNNIHVLNMLNTKYIIADDDKGTVFPYENTEANGNAWFIIELEKLKSTNAEIKALDSLETKKKAVTTQSIPSKNYSVDSTATIKISKYKPNYLKYKSNNKNDGFAVFSEIYYGQGWKSFIDGKEVPHYRVDYVLRGMEIPKGNHTIEFKFEPGVIKTGSTIALASSILLGLLVIGGLFLRMQESRKSKA